MGVSTFELGVIISIFSFTIIVAKIPLGILAERVGKWPIIPIALLGQSLCLVLYSVISNPWWFYPFRVFHGLLLAAFMPTALAIVSDLSPAGQRGDRVGRFLTSFGIATLFGPFLCSFLLTYYDYVQLLQLVATIPLMGLVAFFLARYRGLHKFSSKRSLRETRRSSPLRSLRTFAFSRHMLILCHLRLTFSFTNAFLITLLAVYASEHLALSASRIAFLFGIRGATNAMFRVPSGKLADRIGHKSPLILTFLLLPIAYLVISEFGNFYILSFAMAVYGLAHGMRTVTEWSLLGARTPPESSGVAIAYLSTMFDIGEALGAIVAGALSLLIPIPKIFQLASLILLTGVVTSSLIRQDVRPLESI